MTKFELLPGMVVEYRNGYRRIVLNNKFIGTDGFMVIEDYDSNLICKSDDTFTIVKVYKTSGWTLGNLFDYSNLTLIWEREEFKPGYYTQGTFIFKYEGLKKDFPEVEGSPSALVYSMLTDKHNIHKIGKNYVGIGCSLEGMKSAGKADIIRLYADTLENGKVYYVNDGEYSWIFRHSYVDNIGQIHFSECYDMQDMTCDYDPGAVCEVTDVVEIREATEEEAKKLIKFDFNKGEILYIKSFLTFYVIKFDQVKYGTIYATEDFYNGYTKTIKHECLGGICSISDIKEIRIATPEEKKLLYPVQELTVAELEKKLGMSEGTLRIKK